MHACGRQHLVAEAGGTEVHASCLRQVQEPARVGVPAEHRLRPISHALGSHYTDVEKEADVAALHMSSNTTAIKEPFKWPLCQ